MAVSEVGHEGIIVSVAPEKTCVRIVSTSACASCHAAGLCSVAERQDKIIEVTTPPGASFSEGDTVRVVLSESKGLKAVLLSYAAPAVLLLAVVLALSACGVHELIAGFAGVASVGLYYFLLWLFRSRIRREYVFSIKD